MNTASQVAVAFVAGLHVFFALLEMVLWTKPQGRKAFGTTREFAESTRALAANQGLYNLFLAAGLVWSLVAGPAAVAIPVATFFLACVAVAGVFGALTVAWRIVVIQSVPAVVGLVLVLGTGA